MSDELSHPRSRIAWSVIKALLAKHEMLPGDVDRIRTQIEDLDQELREAEEEVQALKEGRG
jgi:chromosome segregation ATPase